MAVIKYEINGKANTKPMKDTETAAQGMFKKISQIDTMLKGFVGVKVFSEVGKAISNSLKEYDKFKSSLNEESGFTRQMNSLKTSLSATLGTVRDEMAESLGNIFNGDFMDVLKNTIPKVGANLIASMKVGEAIVINIKNNFRELLKPETWNEFFSHATSLADNFCTFFANLLKDTFSFSIDFFKWGFENMNLFKLLWTPANKFLEAFYKGLGFLGGAIAPGLEDFFNDIAKTYGNAHKADLSTMPKFGLSDDTKTAFGDMGSELKKTFDSLLDTLAGENVNTLYSSAYNEALNNLKITIDKMEQAANGNTKAVKGLMDVYRKNKISAAQESISGAASGFNAASSNINTILGNAQYAGASKIREAMQSLNNQFDETSKKVDKLFDRLKEAKTVNEIEEIFNGIRDGVEKIAGLTGSMNGIEEAARRAAAAADLLTGILGALGDAGTVIQAVMDSNPIGLIITLITKLMDTLGRVTGSVGAFLNIFTVFFDIVWEIITELGPAIDTILRPVLSVVEALGRVLGSLLNIIMPIVSILLELAGFEIILKAVAFILNIIATAFAWVADAIGHVYNFISKFVNKVTFGLVDMGTMATDNFNKMRESIEVERNYDEYQNNSSSSTVQGDMYINIYYNHSYVNGDAREIALNIRDEIRFAESAGY